MSSSSTTCTTVGQQEKVPQKEERRFVLGIQTSLALTLAKTKSNFLKL